MEPTSPKRAVGVYFFAGTKPPSCKERCMVKHISTAAHIYTDDLAYVCNAPL